MGRIWRTCERREVRVGFGLVGGKERRGGKAGEVACLWTEIKGFKKRGL